jgi:Putative MetA-pathway of phenol degradation
MKQIQLSMGVLLLAATICLAGDAVDKSGTADIAAPTNGSAAKPDKNSFDLFNPTPKELMRSFSTDRPCKYNSPTTVDAGHFQFESDLFNYTYDQKSGVRNESYFIATPVMKVGLLNNTDLEVTIVPYANTRTRDLNAGTINSSSGFGDILTRVKVNLWGNEGGETAFALIPYIKAPTASSVLGNGEVEGGVIAPFSLTLPADWTMTIQSSVDVLEDTTGNGHHAATSNLIAFAHPLIKNMVLELEFFTSVSTEKNTQWVGTADWAIAYIFVDDWQIDWGVNTGVTNSAPEVNPYIGLSSRF